MTIRAKNRKDWTSYFLLSDINTTEQKFYQYNSGAQPCLHITIAWREENPQTWGPPSRKADLIDLGYNPDIWIFENSLGDSDVQPELRTAVGAGEGGWGRRMISVETEIESQRKTVFLDHCAKIGPRPGNREVWPWWSVWFYIQAT